MSAVEVSHRSIGITCEHGHRRILTAVAVLASQIVFERILTGAQESQIFPSARAGVFAKRRRVGGRNDSEVDILGQMMSDAVVSVDPHRAHGAGLRLLL